MWKLFKKKKTRYPCYNHFDEIKQHYQQKCTSHNITPHLRVLQKLKKARIKSRVSLRDLQLDDRQLLAFLEVLLLDKGPGEQWHTVILKGNHMTDACCALLARIVEKHPLLAKLDLSSNRLTVDGVKLIHDAVMKRQVKLILNLSNNEHLDKIAVKTFVLACRDVKDIHDINANLDTDLAITETRHDDDKDDSSVDEDLTSFSPSSAEFTSPPNRRHHHHHHHGTNHASAGDPTSPDSQGSDAHNISTELDTSREVHDIQHDDSFATTEHTDMAMTQSSVEVSRQSAIASGGAFSPPHGAGSSTGSPTASPQMAINLSGATDISRIPHEHQMSMNTSPLVKLGNTSKSESPQQVARKDQPANSGQQRDTSKTKPPHQKQTPLQRRPAASASSSRATTPRKSSSARGIRRPGTPQRKNTPPASPSTKKSARSSVARSSTPRSSTPRSSRHSKRGSTTPKTGRSLNKDSSQRSSFQAAASENARSRAEETILSKPVSSSSTNAKSKPTPSSQPQSARTQHSGEASASSQQVQYTLSPSSPRPPTAEDKSLVYSPMTPASPHNTMAQKHTTTTSQLHSNRPTTTEGDVSPTGHTSLSSPLGEDTSLVSPLRDPNHQSTNIAADSPTELHAVSREISELSGVDSMALHQQNLNSDFPFDDDDDIDGVELSEDEDDEDLHYVDDILNEALQKHEKEVEDNRKREQNAALRAQRSEGGKKRKWIQPNIYKYKRLKEKKKRLEIQKELQRQKSPPRKKKLKKVRADPEKRSTYLKNVFVLQFESPHLHNGRFQYETPLQKQVYGGGDGESATPRPDTTTTSTTTEPPTHSLVAPFHSPIILPGDDVIEETNDDSLSLLEDASDVVLPDLSHLDEPVVAISLRAANIHRDDISLEECFNKMFSSSFATLQCLDLSFNRIQELSSDFFSHLANLEVLSLRGNQLTSLSGIEHNIQLRQLDVAGNRLESAEYLEYMMQLEVLDISYNRIQSVAGFRMLTMNKHLHILNVEGNPAQLRNPTELRITLTTLLKEHLRIFNNEVSQFYRYKKRAAKRNARLEEVRKNQQPFLPSSPNSKIDLSRRISIRERYDKDAEEKRRQRQEKEEQEAAKRRAKLKRQRESRKKFYTKVKWQQLNTVPRLETPRYRSVDDLHQQLNVTLKHSSTVLDSILEHASPRGVGIPRALRGSSSLNPSSSMSSAVTNNSAARLTRSERLFQSISHDVSDLQNNPPKDDEYRTTDAAQLAEVKEDLGATFMAFATLTEYMNRDAHYSEILELRKLLEDCSLFDPLYIDSVIQSPAIQEYVKRANQTKEKLRILFDAYDEDKQLEQQSTLQLSENGNVDGEELSPQGEYGTGSLQQDLDELKTDGNSVE